jgi:4-hydroxybenzoate polyprenyltransferase
VAVIFALAFPMRHRWHNSLMIVVAPLIGLVVNGMRITLLALLITIACPTGNGGLISFMITGVP